MAEEELEERPVQRQPIAGAAQKVSAARQRSLGQATITTGSGYVDEGDDDGFVVEDDPDGEGEVEVFDDDDDL